MKRQRTTPYYIYSAALTLLLALALAACGHGDAMRMNALIAEADSMNRNYVDFTTDSAMLLAAGYFDRHGTPNERMKAHYLLGCAYRDMGEAPRALAAFHDAIDCADTTATDCDYTLLVKVHGQMASLLLGIQLPHEALEAAQKALEVSRLIGDTAMVVHCEALKAHSYYLVGQLDSVVYLSERQSRYFLLHGDTIYSNISLKSAIAALLDMGRLQEAHKAIAKFEQLLKYDTLGYVKQALGNYDILKGHYYLLASKLDSARHYLRRAASTANVSPAEKVNLYRLLASYYAKIGQADSVLKYSQLYVAKDDSVYRVSVRQEFHKMHALFNYERIKRSAEQKEYEISRLKSFIAISLLLFCVLALLAVAYSVWKKRKMDVQLSLLNKKYTDSLVRYSIVRKETELLEQSAKANSTLIRELSQEKDNNHQVIEKLRQKVSMLESDVKQHREELDKQGYIVSCYQKDKKSPQQWSKGEQLFNLPLISHLHDIVSKGQQPSDQQMMEMKDIIESLHPAFTQKIQELYPQINPQNLLFCISTKLRFINSERAVIFNMSPQSVTNRSSFLYKKLTGRKGGSGDFERLIQDF